jgi:anti-sigma regulatory factor (Ser/Thr protein kinase)
VDRSIRSTSLRVAGGDAAPRAAREAVVSVLDGQVGAQLLSDAQLIVSELVTNSVVHAQMGPDDAIDVDLGLSGDRLRIAVADDGAVTLPHAVDPDIDRASGRGLLLVERLSRAWGVIRERSGRTRVWCELLVAAAAGPTSSRD